MGVSVNYLQTIKSRPAVAKTLAALTTAVALPVMAAADTAPIETAKADLLAYAAALLALGVAVWGAIKVVKMFGGK